MRADLRRFTYKLFAMLGQVGVYHLQMPPKKVLDSEFGKNLKPKRDKRQQAVEHKGVSLSRNQVRWQACPYPAFVALRIQVLCTCLTENHEPSQLRRLLTLHCALQTALYSALLMIANSANMGLAEDSRRAAAVLRLYEDTLAAWETL
jgi:hypothetical protein